MRSSGSSGSAVEAEAGPTSPWQAALAQLAEGVIIVDAAGGIAFANAAAARLHGVARLDAAGNGVERAYELLDEEGEARPLAELSAVRAARRGETVVDAHWRIRRADGSEVPVAGTAAPLRTAGDASMGVVLTLREDHARGAADAAVRERDALAHQLRAWFEQSPVSTVVYDATGRPLAVNGAFERLWGAAMSDVPADYSVLTDPQLAAAGVLPQIRRAFEGETVTLPALRYEMESAVGRGRVLWTEAHLYPVCDPAGRVVQVVLTHDDVTRRREAEAVLREAAQRSARLQALAAALSKASTMAEVADAVVTHVSIVADAVGTVIARLTAGGDELEIMGARAMPDDLRDEWRRFQLDAPVPLADVTRSGEAIFLESRDDWQERYPHLLSMLQATGQHANAVMPLVVDGRVLGVLGVAFDAPRPFSETDRALMRSVALQCAQALERARLLEAERAARAEAQAAEARLRDVVEQAPLAVAVMAGPNHVFTLVSPRYAQTPGMGRPLLGRPIRDAFPEIVSQGYLDVMDEVYRSGVPYFAAERPVLVDAGRGELEERYYNVGYQPLRDATGTVYAIASVSYDVTDHVQARREVEIARAQAETRRDQLDAVLAQTPVGVIIVEAPSGRALVINDAAARLWGRRPQTESVAQFSADWIGYRADGSRLGSHEWPLARAIAEGVTVASETVEIERPDGARSLVDVSAAPVRDAAGRITAAVAIIVDITARVQAETERERLLRALEIERARLAYVFDKAPAFLAVVRGAHHVFELVNDAYYRLVGHRALLGRPVVEALPELREQGFSALLDGVLATGEPFVGRELPVVLARTPDEPPEERFVDFVYLPLVDADGTRSGVIAHGTDVTAHVRARRDVERLLAESERARADAEAARAEAEAANRAKADFLAVMSHELRTPLNAIGGYAELMEMGIRGPVTSEQRDDLRRIQTSQRHLLGLINEVLNYAKLETGTVHYDLDAVRVREPLTAAESLVAPQARAKGLTLAVGDCPPARTARADLEKLRQILVNLLSNAVKFTDRGGVTVGTDEDDTRVFIRVHDTGIGIPADKLEAIFEPFTQVRADLTRPHEGTGLGLAISRDLARGMGGDLTVESALGSGSTFVLSLPKG